MKSGNYSCAEGAIAAGCEFYVDNPFTSSSEIAEHMAERLSQVGGHYLQMEDEISSIAAVLGASKGGLKSMAAILGPELSPTINDSIALAVMTETPCVLLRIEGKGNGNGSSGFVDREDLEAKLASQGSYQTITYAPNSVQEMFDLTVKAFNMAETHRRPVFIMLDRFITNMIESLVIPSTRNIELVQRRAVRKDPDSLAFDLIEDLPPIAVAHRGHHSKIDTLARNDTDLAAEVEHYHTEDAKVVVVAYGSTSRTALLAINKARRATKKVGLLRLITQSPFPAREIGQLKAEKIIIPETDHGQVERLVKEHTSSPIIVLHHAAGMSFSEDEIYEALEKS